MKKFELSITPDYVVDWGTVEAIRELFQNALDQQTINPTNKMFFTYDELSETLKIGNKDSILNVQSLLLGSTSKHNDDSTIGKFGEGYKIATLVLLRLNKKVIFYNYGNREVWKPRLVNSRRYNGAKILTFFVDTSYFWQSVPDNNLTIEVNGVTKDEYNSIIESNLHCQDEDEDDTINTEYGRILTKHEHKGKLFVNGLYICTDMSYDYGYDFKPKYIHIDRDRKLMSDFNMQWLMSRIWASTIWSGEKAQDIVSMAKKGSKDINYLSSHTTCDFKEDSDNAYDNFKKQYGDNAVPVTSQDELDKYKYTSKPILVNNTYKNIIKSSQYYEEPVIQEVETPKELLEKWMETVSHKLTEKEIDEFSEIIECLKF